MDVKLEHIISRCFNHDRKAQEELYYLCYDNMIKVCLRYVSNMDDAYSLYNDAMLKAFRGIHQYDYKGEFLGWVRRIVVNTCIDFCRKKAKFLTQSLDDVTAHHENITPDVYSKLGSADIMLLVQELPNNTKLVFNLFVIEGYKHEEISKIVGISAGTSKWHLNEARKILKVKIENLSKNNIYSNVQ
jgi:RNA polymerase sigma-70 factor, ECF subfamily